MENTQLGNIAFIGEVDAGKSALINKLIDQETNIGKTQSPIFYQGRVIDTPGEFIDNRSWNGALLSTISSVKTIVILQPATTKRLTAPSGLLRVYPNKNIVGVISKVDAEGADCERASALFKQHGIHGPFFYTSIFDQASIDQLYDHLLSFQPVVLE
ncbi:EutP/PduV family microcompartment system protein [Photobacterium indicum]|uniref:Ethanolamine utilization protein n=1 Tax=Photobacterium indicum TaxID=81447 RepID=A0A2T3LF02_9GAMM|nr:EutP/PduV family microcompartment system protein [Photobacterium indicum]PSV49957.1 ethanolamine utilization protein [Photobacterium indicum]